MKELNTSYDSIIANKKNIQYCDIVKTVTYSRSSCGNTGKAMSCEYNWIHRKRKSGYIYKYMYLMSNNTQNCSIITISGSLWWCQHKSRLKYLFIHKPVLKANWCAKVSKERWNLTFKLLFSIAPLQLTELPLSTDCLAYAVAYNWAIGLLTFNQSIKFHKLNPYP